MGKKATPRWNEFGFPDEAMGFALSDRQAADLWEYVSLADKQVQNALRTRLVAIACEHLERREDDKTRPALREQNAALGEILEAAKVLETNLREIDYVSHDELCHALTAAPYRHEDGSEPEGGFEQLGHFRCRIEHFTRALEPHLERLKAHRGPIEQRTSKALITEVARAFEEVTGRQVTHTAHKSGAYKGRVQSPIGKFIWAFIQMVDGEITEQTVSSVLATHVNQRGKQHGINTPQNRND